MTEAYDIERETERNTAYRRVLTTTPQMQLVLMTLNAGESIPLERHMHTTQFIRIESGTGILTLPDENRRVRLREGIAVVIPPRTRHEIRHTGRRDTPLCLYTLYSPPEHPAGLIQRSPP